MSLPTSRPVLTEDDGRWGYPPGTLTLRFDHGNMESVEHVTAEDVQAIVDQAAARGIRAHTGEEVTGAPVVGEAGNASPTTGLRKYPLTTLAQAWARLADGDPITIIAADLDLPEDTVRELAVKVAQG